MKTKNFIQIKFYSNKIRNDYESMYFLIREGCVKKEPATAWRNSQNFERFRLYYLKDYHTILNILRNNFSKKIKIT